MSDHTPGIDEIEADIARSRDALAATVDELTGRLDVKARTKARVAQTSPVVLGGAAFAAVALVVLAVWRRRNR